MNVVLILADQHNARFAGCYGHPLAQTPNIDRIAREGIRYHQAWCASPLCVPSRASLFTGRYTFEHACWDNCIAWDGRLKGWPTALANAGVHLTTIGKLDFAPGEHGIAEQHLGAYRTSRDIHSLFRTEANLPPRWQEHAHLQQSGPKPGMTLQSLGDWQVLERTRTWLETDRLQLPAATPWVLNVNFLEPHPAWPCPPDLWEKWRSRVTLDMIPPLYFQAVENLHPVNQGYAHHCTGQYTTKEDVLTSYIAYLAHCEIIDTLVGHVLDKLEQLNLLNDTLVIYTADHGEGCHAHGLWGKMHLYEEALRVPLCAIGPGIPAGRVEFSPASLLDLFPTCLAAAAPRAVTKPNAADSAPTRQRLRGISLLPQMRSEANARRNAWVFSEYHANGASTGSFAITDGRYKLCEYPGHRPALFDLHNDPDELHDIIVEKPNDHEGMVALRQLRAQLNQLCSPAAVDLHAKNDQALLRREMERDGSLAVELHNRGYEKRSDKMVPRPEMIPERFRNSAQSPP